MICTWTPTPGGLMRFAQLDAIQLRVYALAWRFKDCPADPWTKRLNAFKERDAQAIKAACGVMPYAVSKFPWVDKKIIMVSAMPSAETYLPPTHGLYCLGEAIASAVNWEWKPEALTKLPHRQLHRIFSASERDAEVAGKYSIAQAIDADYVCILDDLITRGATMAEIVRAIREHNPRIGFFGIVLGKTETQGYAISNGYNIDNNHVPEEYTEMWDSISKEVCTS